MKKARQENQGKRMKSLKRTVTGLAEEYKDPDEFVNMLVKLVRVSPNERGDLFLETGKALYESSNFSLALNLVNRALDFFDRNKKNSKKLDCYGNLGLIKLKLCDFRNAEKCFNKALRILRDIKNTKKRKSAESKCYMGLGNCLYNQGNFRKAIEYYMKSLHIAEEIKDEKKVANAHLNIGNIYRDLGEFNKSIECFKKSLAIAEKHEERALKSKCYLNIGTAYHNLRKIDKAIEKYNYALEIAVKIGDKSLESACYGNIGFCYYNLEEPEKSIEYYKKSLVIAEKILDRVGELKYYLNIGNVYRSLGKIEEAILNYKRSLKIARETGNIDSERVIKLNFGLIYFESQPRIAHKYLKHSIKLSETISGNLVEEQHKIGFLDRAIYAYQLIIPICLNLKKENEAFEYTERSKSRAFLDLLSATEIKPTCEITDKLQSLLDKEKMDLAKLRQIQMRHLRPAKIPVEPGEVEKIRKNLTEIYDRIGKYDPKYVFVRKGKPLSVTKIQEILSSQERDVTLLEYYIIRKKVIIFVISSKTDQLHTEIVPLPIGFLEQYIGDYWKGRVGYRDLREDISGYFIEPISEFLGPFDLIYFVPFGLLHYFPLHALILDGEPLIKRHPVAYLPSSSLFQFCQNKGSGTPESCASFGVEFEDEAKEVAKLFNSDPYNGPLAVKNMVLENCNKDIIHFACHGSFDQSDPLSSGVKLHDSILTAREIFDIRLTTELVTLGGCFTGINERSSGDELAGLTRAFLYAGAPSVVVSLWPVYGPSTQRLMLEFYAQLKNGEDKATALQQAQIALMETKKYSRPFFWAPFVLIGDWR